MRTWLLERGGYRSISTDLAAAGIPRSNRSIDADVLSAGHLQLQAAPMKVTVQNGATHGLSRRDVESIIPLFPRAWLVAVQQIVLYQGKGKDVSALYYPEKRLLGLFWPVDATNVSKAAGLEELLVALSVVADRGELPARLSKSIRKRHAGDVATIHASCLEAMASNAA